MAIDEIYKGYEIFIDENPDQYCGGLCINIYKNNVDIHDDLMFENEDQALEHCKNYIDLLE